MIEAQQKSNGWMKALISADFRGRRSHNGTAITDLPAHSANKAPV
jgi:hypothetical protein